MAGAFHGGIGARAKGSLIIPGLGVGVLSHR